MDTYNPDLWLGFFLPTGMWGMPAVAKDGELAPKNSTESSITPAEPTNKNADRPSPAYPH